MTSLYTPTPTKLVNVTEPVGGELRNTASVTRMTRTLADGIAYLQQAPLASLTALAALAAPADGDRREVVGFGVFHFKTSATTGFSPFRVAAADATPGGWVSDTAHETTVIRMVGGQHVNGISSNAGVKAGANPAVLWTEFVPVTSADVLRKLGGAFLAAGTLGGATLQYAYVVPLDAFLIDGATLSSITAYLQGGGSHVALPARMPKIAVVKANITTLANVAMKSTSAGYTTDTAASAAAFDAIHTISQVTDQNNVIDRTLNSYYGLFLDEDGANATGGTYFQGFSLSLTNIPDARRS